MLGLIIGTASLIITVGLVAWLFNLTKNRVTAATSGKKPMEVVGTIALMLLIAVGFVVTTYKLWFPITDLVVAAVKSSGTAHPLAPMIGLSLLMGLIILSAKRIMEKALMQLSYNEGELKWRKPLISFTALGIWLFSTISFLTNLPGTTVAYWSIHITIIVVFAYLGYVFINEWYEKNQRKTAVFMSYWLNIGITTMIGLVFGVNYFANISGSWISQSTFLLINLCLFILMYILGNGTRDKLKERISFYLMGSWTLLLITILGSLIYIQATNQMSIAEIYTSRAVTIVEKELEDLTRVVEMDGYTTAFNKAMEAKNDGNIQEMERQLSILRDLDVKQRKIRRAQSTLPEGVEKYIHDVKEIIPFMGEDERPELNSSANLLRTKSPFKPLGPGRYEFTAKAGIQTNFKKIAPNMVWELYPRDNLDWDLVPFKGTIIKYTKANDQYVDFPELPMIFAVKTHSEDMVFVLDVYPKNS